MGRASFASGTNALNADSGIKKTTVSGNIYNTVTGGTCSNVSTGEKGVMPITAFNAASVVKSKYVSSANIKFDYREANGRAIYTYLNSTPGDCGSGGQGKQTIKNAVRTMTYSLSSSGRNEWRSASGGGLVGALIASFGWRPTVLVDANGNFSINQPSKTVTTTGGSCLYSYYSDSDVFVDPITSNGKCMSWKFNASFTFTTYASITGTPTVTTTYCPTLTNAAGNALVRPYVKVKASDIIMRNSAKRTYSQSAVLNTSAIPTSDNTGTFLTLQTSALSVVLNSGAAGVVGNVYEEKKQKTGTTISLPVYFGTANLTDGTDSTRYVSAE